MESLHASSVKAAWFPYLAYGVVIVALCVAPSLLPVFCEPILAQQVAVNPYADDSQAIEEGGKTYREICSHCHGFAGEGGIGGSLYDSLWVKASSDKALYGVIAMGRKNTQMTPYEALGEDMVWKLVGFVRKLQEGGGAKAAPGPSPAVAAEQAEPEAQQAPTEPGGVQVADVNPYANDPGAIEEGGEMYREICSHCHGFLGEGGIGRSLNTSRWIKVSSDKALYSVIARGRKNTQMTPYEALGEDMVWKLVGFVRKLQEGAGT